MNKIFKTIAESNTPNLKGIKNIKNAFKWEGWKKEGFWIAFFILLSLAAYGYYLDKQAMEKVSNSQCYKKCIVEEYITQFKIKNPGVNIQCDDRLMTCTLSGVFKQPDMAIPRINISIGNDTGNE